MLEEDLFGNILVVGGAGYVGGYLVDHLVEMGCDVVVYDNLMYETRYMKDVEFVYGDCRDKAKLRALLPEFATVIWLAAIVGDGACAVDPFLTQHINEDMPKWLVQNFKGKIVYPSTCSVYGINNELIDESATPNPLSVYGETKLAAEQYIVENAEDYLIFRLGTLYGIGDCLSRIRLDLVVNILTKLAAEGKPLTVNGGEQWRPLLHVRDVAHAMFYGLEAGISGMFNLSSGNYTITDISKVIQQTLNTNVVINYVDMPYEDQRNYRVKNGAWLAHGWESAESLPRGIKQIAELVSSHRIKDLNDPVYHNERLINQNYWRM